MSGRYTFTAGSTLTAAQLNTNVMDGIFYKQQVGQASVTTTATATWSTGTVAVTLTGFTVAPRVTVSGSSASSNQIVGQASAITTSGFTVRGSVYANVAATLTFDWIATQATSSTASGS